MNWDKEILNAPSWKEEISNREEKERIARIMASKVKDGDVIGFGSGSTSYLTILEINKRIMEEGINVQGIPTSNEIEMLCSYLGIEMANLVEKKPDYCFDGADHVDCHGNLIKGRGAALYKEKLNMKSCDKTYILVDDTKMVNEFDSSLNVPIEITPNSISYVQEELKKLGAIEINIRLAVSKDGPVITENGCYILETKFERFYDGLEKDIKSITGVLESGLFMGYNVEIIK